MRRSIFPIVISCLLFLTSCQESEINNQSLTSELQSSLEQIIDREGVRGISAALMVNDELVSASAGVSTTNVPITHDMIFGSGSVTKTFTATLVLQLAEQGFLHLDDAISKWLDPITHVDPEVTITQLLTHTSGIFSYTQNTDLIQMLIEEPNRHLTPFEILEYLREPIFEKGTSWSYSNTNYLLLGMIIESVSGMSYYNLIHANILEPLDMENTFLPPFDDITLKNVAHSWFPNASGELEDTFGQLGAAYTGAWSAGAIHSTSADLIRFIRALMTSEIINESSLNQMISFVAVNEENHPHFGGYGYGVMQFLTIREYWGHSGDFFGYRSNMVYVPQDNIFLAFHINQEVDESVRVNLTTELIELAVKHMSE